MEPQLASAMAAFCEVISRALLDLGKALALEAEAPRVVEQPPCPVPHVVEPSTSPDMVQQVERLLKPKEAADALRVHPRTIYRWIDQGVLGAIPLSQKSRTCYLIPGAEVQRLLQEAIDKAAEKRAELGVRE